MKKQELNEIVAFCKKNWNTRLQKTLDTAAAVCKNELIFDMPWDLERTEKVYHFQNCIDWNCKIDNDSEFLFQLNRHTFFIHLSQAFIITGNTEYADAFFRHIEDWIDYVPYNNSTDGPWRSLEVALRAKSWITVLDYLEDYDCLSPSLKEKIDSSLKQHMNVLKKEHEAFHIGSNWGIIQDCCLFAIARYFNDDETSALAVNRLCEEVTVQIMSDGMHWEQSSGYHNAVLSELLEVMCTSEKTQYALPETLTSIILNMAEINLKWIKPNGQHPLFGDSDDNDVRDILSRSALLFNREDFKSQGFSVLDYDSAWLFGINGIEKYKMLTTEAPDFCNTFIMDSGNYILRSDWSNTANWLCMHNGYTGGGHAHADKLHFDLMICGRDVLVDGGRYTYKFTTERACLKSALGHNTAIVGKKGFLKPVNTWSAKAPALSVQNPHFENKDCVLIGGGHLGYLKSKSIYSERKILWIKPDIYIVLDSFFSKFFHKYHQFFHFSPDGLISIKNNNAIFCDEKIKVQMHFIANHIRLQKMQSLYSPHYNKICKNEAVKTSFYGCTDCSAITVIHGSFHESFDAYSVEETDVFLLSNGKKLKKSVAQGIVIKTKKQEYTICFVHKEMKTPLLCNGKIITGRITVLKNDEQIFQKW